MLTVSKIWCLFCLSLLEVSTGSLTVHVSDIETQDGAIHAALYDTQSAYDEEDIDPALGKKITSWKGASCTLTWEDLPHGTYALAVYHDVNDNGKLDTNTFGIPTEPYAFSNNPAVKWRRPRFREVSFPVDSSDTTLELRLSRWSDR